MEGTRSLSYAQPCKMSESLPFLPGQLNLPERAWYHYLLDHLNHKLLVDIPTVLNLLEKKVKKVEKLKKMLNNILTVSANIVVGCTYIASS